MQRVLCTAKPALVDAQRAARPHLAGVPTSPWPPQIVHFDNLGSLAQKLLKTAPKVSILTTWAALPRNVPNCRPSACRSPFAGVSSSPTLVHPPSRPMAFSLGRAEGSLHGEACSLRRTGSPPRVCTSQGCQSLSIFRAHGPQIVHLTTWAAWPKNVQLDPNDSSLPEDFWKYQALDKDVWHELEQHFLDYCRKQ